MCIRYYPVPGSVGAPDMFVMLLKWESYGMIAGIIGYDCRNHTV